MDTVEGNKLIDVFKRGSEVLSDGKHIGMKRGSGPKHYNYYDVHLITELKYHSSWDWLMGVVGKIEEDMLAYVIRIEEQECYIQLTEVHPDEGGKAIETQEETKIKAVWHAVIQFIQFYNNSIK